MNCNAYLLGLFGLNEFILELVVEVSLWGLVARKSYQIRYTL